MDMNLVFYKLLVETCAIGHKKCGQWKIFVSLFIQWELLNSMSSDLAILL